MNSAYYTVLNHFAKECLGSTNLYFYIKKGNESNLAMPHA